MTELGAWLEARLAEAPAALRKSVLAAVEADGSDGSDGSRPGRPAVAEVLRRRAEVLLDRAANAPSGSDAALMLLTADALATLACQWTAEHAPDALERAQ